MARPITVNNFGNGTYLGGNTNNNSTFSGAITLAESVTIVSAATGNNAVTFSGAISNGGTGFGVNVLGPGNVVFRGFQYVFGCDRSQRRSAGAGLLASHVARQQYRRQQLALEPRRRRPGPAGKFGGNQQPDVQRHDRQPG